MDDLEDITPAAPSRDSIDKNMHLVDRGQRTQLQFGDNNVIVDLELPTDIKASEMPTVDFPVNNQPTEQDHHRYRLDLCGYGARVQFGPANRLIYTRRTVPSKADVQDPIPQPQTEPVQVSEQEREDDGVSAVQEQDVEDTNNHLDYAPQIAEDIIELVKTKMNNDHPTHDNVNNSFMEINLADNNHTKASSEFQQPARSPNIPLMTDISDVLNTYSTHRSNSHEVEKDLVAHPSRGGKQIEIYEHVTVLNEISTETFSTKEGACQSLVKKEDVLPQSPILFREVRGNYARGSSRNIIDIHVTNTFLERLEEDRDLPDIDTERTMISLKWTSQNGHLITETQCTVTDTQFLKELLIHLTHDVFAPLRTFVGEIYLEYKAELQSVSFTGDKLVFAFWHGDDEWAQRMIESSLLKSAIHKMFISAGKGDTDFKMECSYHPRNREDVRHHSSTYRAHADLVQDVGRCWEPHSDFTTRVPKSDNEDLKSSIDTEPRLLLMERKLDDFIEATKSNFDTMKTLIQLFVKEHENKESTQQGPRDERKEAQNIGTPTSISSNQYRADIVGGFPTQRMSVLEIQDYAYEGKAQIRDPKLASTYHHAEVTNEPHDNTPIKSTRTPLEHGTSISSDDAKCQYQTSYSSEISVDCERSITVPSKKTSTMWQWQDDDGSWKCYDNEQSEKLSMEFDKRPNGTCLLQKGGESVRVMFSGQMEERSLTSKPRLKYKVKRIGPSDLMCDDPSSTEPVTDKTPQFNK